jgi:hypothetical protein
LATNSQKEIDTSVGKKHGKKAKPRRRKTGERNGAKREEEERTTYLSL